MQVKSVKITAIKPYEKNPRINDNAVDAVAASIEQFGWQQPIVVDKGGIIIVGHTRYKAQKKLGLKEVPVVRADELTDEQVKAYRIADNSTHDLSEWEWRALTEEIEGISIDMGQFGVDTDNYIETESVLEDIDDPEPPAVPENPTTQKGQIYRLGDHVLLCGDATSAEDMERLMDAMGGGPRT